MRNITNLINLLFTSYYYNLDFGDVWQISKLSKLLRPSFTGMLSTVKYKNWGHRSSKNAIQFYLQFANFFPFNVLYKKFQVFELKNHKNCQNAKKMKIYKFSFVYNFWTLQYFMLKIFSVFEAILKKIFRVWTILKFWGVQLTWIIPYILINRQLISLW